VGAKGDLRGARMYEFLDRLINIAMPRIRDFRGVFSALVRRARATKPGPIKNRLFPRDPVRTR